MAVYLVLVWEIHPNMYIKTIQMAVYLLLVRQIAEGSPVESGVVAEVV